MLGLVAVAAAIYLVRAPRKQPSRQPVAAEGPPATTAPLTLPAEGVNKKEEPETRPPRPEPTVSRPATKGALIAGQTRENPNDGLKYVYIPAGKLTMGCAPGDTECDNDEKPPHEVTITKAFWLGQTPVTQEAYQRVIGTNLSYFKGPRLPVETVNWYEARSYCEVVGMRLPTEAEWEYAARAGSTAARYGNLDETGLLPS